MLFCILSNFKHTLLAAEIDLYLTTFGQAMQFIETSGMLKRQCMYCLHYIFLLSAKMLFLPKAAKKTYRLPDIK